MKIGVLGAGQLGRMLALAGIPLGHEFVFVDPEPNSCAAGLGTFLNHSFDHHEWVGEFAEQVDVITMESENIPIELLSAIPDTTPVYPAANAIEVAQDRVNEKQLFQKLGIPTAKFYAINHGQDIIDAFNDCNSPLMLKTRRFGYDGKGQQLLKDVDQAEACWQALGEVPLIAEKLMHFQREVSIITVRRANGDTQFYPLAQNEHRNGILFKTQALALDDLSDQAHEYAKRIINELGYVGVLTLELFDCDGKLVANEIAPRVHNSGHWTIEGAVTSQFENHIRAITDTPLGETDMCGESTMINLIGSLPNPADILTLPCTHLHDYGKSPRPGRKLGHITVCDNSTSQMQDSVDKIIDLTSTS